MLPLHWAGVLSSLSHLLVQITRPPLPLPGQGIDSKVKPQSVRSSQLPLALGVNVRSHFHWVACSSVLGWLSSFTSRSKIV